MGLGVLGLLGGQRRAAVGFGAFAAVRRRDRGRSAASPSSAARLFRPICRLFGLEGRLAADNTARNPKRTATTANALLIGVFLVTFVTVAGTSLKDFAVEEIHKLDSADYFLDSTGGRSTTSWSHSSWPIDGVEQVTPFRREPVTLDGDAVSHLDGRLRGARRRSPGSRSPKGSFDDLGPGGIVVTSAARRRRARWRAPTLGSTVTLTNSGGDTVDLEVVGIVDAAIDVVIHRQLRGAETFDSFVGETEPASAFVDVASGAQSDSRTRSTRCCRFDPTCRSRRAARSASRSARSSTS